MEVNNNNTAEEKEMQKLFEEWYFKNFCKFILIK